MTMTCMKKDNRTHQVSAEDDVSIYHEKQSRELCALHALNNLFQESRTFTQKELDEICNTLSPASYINPHRSMLGLGNYDVNVIILALQHKGFDTMWFDKRRSPSDLELDNIFGFILNIPTDLRLGILHLPVQRKHWVAIRKVNGDFYNLDSKLNRPLLIGNNQQLVAFLKEQIQNKDKELLLVVKHELENDVWRRSAPRSQGIPPKSNYIVNNGQFKESGV
ncbi:hypothetical protein LSH36_132g05020 [Paralvinella palmiformis]|uniref:Josephin-2 n=1 Tax=Paralvinella palmiformis TaxID=53620 RepID=A0AAD9JYE2_9ANNE|nr:hypothetical protein LSH36_132g05020 [Paralvinella palmiformis]